jgi:hypothetical protein
MAEEDTPKVLLVEEDEKHYVAIWLQTGLVSQGTTADFAVENLVAAMTLQAAEDAREGRKPFEGWEKASARYWWIWEHDASEWRPGGQAVASEAPVARRPRVRQQTVEHHASAE